MKPSLSVVAVFTCAAAWVAQGTQAATPHDNAGTTVAANTTTQDHAASGGHVHWDYSGPTGPNKWGEIDEKFGTCSLGQVQSPIDIRSDQAEPATLDPITFAYKPSPLKIIDNGHTIQVNYAPGSSIAVGGARYELLQFHFHRPSEERVNGKPYDMVAHLVHKDTAGKLAVVGVLLEKGAQRPVLQAVFDHLPGEKGKEVAVPGVSIDLTTLLPNNRAYYTFTGSLTTPPCSEGVTWFVLKQPSQVSADQVARFGQIYAMNARPVQPLNGRRVRVSP
jgi:carbonic anhydrase